jgi:glyoxylase-like metal-dependent hydrolase (beta-lactamase superfamily II)
VQERDAVIAGDLVSGISTILIDPPAGDMGAYLESLRRLERVGARTLLPGHGPPLPGKALAKLIAHRLQREQRLLAGMSAAPAGLPAIARAAYADLPELPAALIERQALAHLLLLERQGHVARDDAGGGSWRLCRSGAST